MRTSSAARQFVTWTPLVAVITILLPAVSAAQEPVKSFDQLNTQLKVGDTIYVTDAQGREVKGKLHELGPSSLVIDSGGPRTVAAADVRLIQERQADSKKDKTLLGLAIGAGGGLLLGGVLAGALDESGSDLSSVESAALFAAIGAGAGAGLGALFDGLNPGKPRVVYRAAGFAGAGLGTVRIAPVVTPRMKGVAVGISF
jgi:hypothetical protein